MRLAVRQRRPRGALLATALAWLLAAACSGSAVPVVELDGRAIGTTWSLRLVDEDGDADPDQLRDLIEGAIDRVDVAASNWRDDSEIAAIDALAAGGSLEISADLLAILEVAREVFEGSGGAFDPTVGPLVAAYGFGAGASTDPPTDDALTAAAARIDFDSFDWSGGRLTRGRDDVTLDLSGVAKGYAVDLAAQALQDAGEARFMLEIGGEVRVSGARPTGGPWVLGVFAPVESRAIHGTIEASDLALATSGDYRAFRDLEDGTRVSHTIDPRFGRAATSRVASATIIAPDCARADALATAVMVLGADEGLAFVESLPGVEAYILVHAEGGFEPRASEGFLPLKPWKD